ncbi:ParB N-terminal domain-containing protein [Thiocystis violacea]|uniref:ParB N-terminal domain-containing protein n=1 Tax=Thiocystis violacea TaxID=13725 RepID=UPI0019056562|nr:ParB N-terminal domain-containing protein [Thiocystis violacea]MBK1718530.1 hypothetical protein [Thiocystis violacea]
MSEATAPKAASKPRQPRGIRLAEEPKVSEFPITGPISRPVPLDQIIPDSRLQFRADGLDQDYVLQLVHAYEEGVDLPPVVLYCGADPDSRDLTKAIYWIADGNHRVAAAAVARLSQIPAIVRHGGRLDARRHALGANADYGKRRTRADLAYAYSRAVEEGDVKPDDVSGLSKLLRCSERWARELTKDARERANLERDATIQRLSEEGKTQRQIAAEVGLTPMGVNKVVNKRNSSESLQISTVSEVDQPQPAPCPNPLSNREEKRNSSEIPQDQPPVDQPQAEPSTVPELVMDSPALQAAKVAYQGLSASDAFAFQVWFASIRTAERRGDPS